MSSFLSNFFGTNKTAKRRSEIKKSSKKSKSVTKSKSKRNSSMGGKPKGIKYKDYYFQDIKRSRTVGKKWDAIFLNDRGKEKRVSFGKSGRKDYVDHNDKDLREIYDKKYKKKENWRDLMSRGALDKWVLNNKQSFNSGFRDYKSRLNGKK